MEVTDINNVPNIKLSSKSIHPFVRIGGPHYSFPDTFIAPYGSELFSSKSISTFPHNPNQIPPREGDPISDRYFCAFYENKALVAISSGYGNGFTAVDASEKAIIGFVEYMTSAQSEILSTGEAAKALEKAFAAAHDKIIEDKDDLSKVGSSSLLGGLLLELNVSEEFGWAFVCYSIGNCKAFLISFDEKEQRVVDITQNNYLVRSSAPPSVFGAEYDSKAAKLYFCPCNKNDVILLLSEGAHANFHPQQLGKGPFDDKANNESKDPEEMKEEEGLWVIHPSDEVKSLLNNSIAKSFADCVLSSQQPFPKPSEMVDRIINYNLRVTKEVREKMISEDMKYADIEKGKYPSFVGHCTSTAIKAIPLVASCSSTSDGLIDKVNCVWQWKAFYPIPTDLPDPAPELFDIWKFLVLQNSQLEEAINKEEDLSFSECFINVKSDDVLFYQVGNTKEELMIEISVRTKASNITRVERWETAGKFTINDKTTKRYLSSTISNLLRQKEFDRRKIKDIILNFLSMNSLRDTLEVKGMRKIVQFPQFGESMKTLSGDVTFSQSKVEIINSTEEAAKKYIILELFSTSEKRIVQFIQKLNLDQAWVICSFPELLNEILKHSNNNNIINNNNNIANNNNNNNLM